MMVCEKVCAGLMLLLPIKVRFEAALLILLLLLLWLLWLLLLILLLLLLLLLLRLLLSDVAMRTVWMSEPVLVGEVQVPPGVGPPVNAAVKKDPTIDNFHSEQLPADP